MKGKKEDPINEACDIYCFGSLCFAAKNVFAHQKCPSTGTNAVHCPSITTVAKYYGKQDYFTGVNGRKWGFDRVNPSKGGGNDQKAYAGCRVKDSQLYICSYNFSGDFFELKTLINPL